MSDHIRAPFTTEQADALNRYQKAGRMHPFTCPREHPSQAVLLAVHGAGWVCGCGYTQDWAHGFMLDEEMGRPYSREVVPRSFELGETYQRPDGRWAITWLWDAGTDYENQSACCNDGHDTEEEAQQHGDDKFTTFWRRDD